MKERQPLSERELEALVRAHLARQEPAVDAGRILAEVHARRKAVASPRWLVRGALAAMVLLAFGLSLHFLLNPTSAATLVRQAREAHSRPVDRCYRVVMEREMLLPDLESSVPNQREALLWTRGDRFRMEALGAQREWATGRDQQGCVWMAISRQVGVRFPADEVPPKLAFAVEVRGMRIDSLLAEVLADFDLQREPPRLDNGRTTQMIHAVLKPGRRHPMLREATLEIDAQTNVIRRMVLSFLQATVTFTLTEPPPQPAVASYELDDYLDPAGVILSRKQLQELPAEGPLPPSARTTTQDASPVGG
jgi:hypothetical protein